jgi:uncharacterized protein (TIGR03067 family)
MVPTRLKSAALPLLTLAALGVALAGDPAGPPKGKGKGKSDQELFQGKWAVVAVEKSGMKIPEEFTKDAAISVKGNTITVELLGETKEAKFKIDPSKKPKAIDLDFEGKEHEGIYELKGDTLRVCFPMEAGAKRPKTFNSEGETVLATFKRAKAGKGGAKEKGGEKKEDKGTKEKPPARPADPAAQKAEQTLLKGTWVVASAEKGGAPVPEEIAKQVKLTLAGDAVTFEIVGDSRTGSYRVDPTRQPRAIDFTVEGKTARGIYALDQGNLKLCFAEPGLPRPKTFKADNDRELLAVLKRAPAAGVGQEKETPQEVSQPRREPAAPRPAARAAQGGVQAGSATNLKQIGLAMHNYHDARRALPAAAIYSKDGKPLLSWRVALLPYLEQQNLYKAFKLDEPWDSEHNKKLLDKMPRVFAPAGVDLKPHTTMYRVFVGPGAAFEGTSGQRLTGFTDGTSNTILVVEAAEAVPWTKPDELPFDPKGKLPKLGGHFKGGFNVLLADGSVRGVRADFDPQLLRAAITRNGGEVLDFDKLGQ